MIMTDELNRARKLIPQRLSKIICYGHIDKDMFNEKQANELKEIYTELAYDKHSLFNLLSLQHEPIALGLWGESTEHITTDLGLACIFFNEEAHIIPKHFMRDKEIAKFIMKVAEEEYPHYLI